VRIIGVLDIRGGVAVRGVGGRREEYRPVSSVLCPGSQPLALARAMRQELGLAELYVADLDAIAGSPPDVQLYEALAREGFRLLVDCGVRTAGPAGPWRLVAGLETLGGPEALTAQMIFSLDLKGGQPLAGPGWPEGPRAILGEAARRGVRSAIVLDLARVGSGEGTGTEELCAWARREWPALEIIAGGGVSGLADLGRLRAVGVDAVLVASALHDGRLTRRDFCDTEDSKTKGARCLRASGEA
jgi:phosphoribosylformimino-5-aminoimidazole carboxamide ribotide isomerase